MDEKAGWVYFYGKKVSPVNQDVFRVQLGGGKVQHISGNLNGWHRAYYAPNYRHYVAFASNAQTPPRVSLRTAEGKLVRAVKSAAAEYENPYPARERKSRRTG